jgi:hypothetical protein
MTVKMQPRRLMRLMVTDTVGAVKRKATGTLLVFGAPDDKHPTQK